MSRRKPLDRMSKMRFLQCLGRSQVVTCRSNVKIGASLAASDVEVLRHPLSIS